MSDLNSCAAGASDILEAIKLLTCAHEHIDNHLVSEYDKFPQACKPDILDDSETSPGGSCPIEKSAVEVANSAHRKFARDYLLDVSEIMRVTGGADMQRISVDVEDAAKKIDVASGDLLLLPQITEILSENTYRMFALFDVCMRGR